MSSSRGAAWIAQERNGFERFAERDRARVLRHRAKVQAERREHDQRTAILNARMAVLALTETLGPRVVINLLEHALAQARRLARENEDETTSL